MPDLLLASVEYSGYISPVKLGIFLALFLGWVAIVCWVYRDAESVSTNMAMWTGIVFGSGVTAILIWFLVPLFIIGLMVFLIAVSSSSITYVVHRNSRVIEQERVLTADHIQRLFSNEEKKLASQAMSFITSNGNPVPVPVAKTPEFYGYKSAIEIFSDAVWRRAVNILYSPTRENYHVVYYIDGAALKQPALEREQMEYFLHFLKQLADLSTSEKRKPQKGKFKMRQGEREIEWELTTAGSTAGEQALLKQVTEENIKTIGDIGLTPDHLEQIGTIREQSEGLFIISGPPKTGVTSTFYAMIRNHDPFLFSINTLERQISDEIENTTQHVFSLTDTGTTTFAAKLQEIVRMGPDIVGVVDCEDAKSAKIVIDAALDGRIMYVTMKAGSVIGALGKWRKLVTDNNLLAKPLLGISNQRLLRKLCDECKQGYEPNKDLLTKFNLPADKVKVFYRPGKVQYDKHGKALTCENCQGTGFFGRLAVFEIIRLNDELRKAITEAKSLAEISAHFRSAKMLGLQQQALRKVIAGQTSINEMIRVFSPPSGKQRAKKPAPKAKPAQEPDVNT